MAKLTPEQAVARSVQYMRRLRGWNQAELAERLTGLGIPTAQSTVARIERGKRGVSLDDAVRLAVALGISLTHLIAGPAVDDDEITLTPDSTFEPDLVRDWIRGEFDFQGDEIYFATLGREEIKRMRRLRVAHVDVTDEMRAKRYSNEKGDK